MREFLRDLDRLSKLVTGYNINILVDIGGKYREFNPDIKFIILNDICRSDYLIFDEFRVRVSDLEIDLEEITGKVRDAVTELDNFKNLYDINGRKEVIDSNRTITFIRKNGLLKHVDLVRGNTVIFYDTLNVRSAISSLVEKVLQEHEDKIRKKVRKNLAGTREIFREYLHDKTKELPSHIQVFLNDKKFRLTKKIEDRNIFFDKAFEYYLMSISNQVVRYYNKSTGQHENESIAHISMMNSEIIVEFKKMINERLVENWRDILQYEWSDSEKYTMFSKVHDYDEMIYSNRTNQGMRIREGVFVLNIYGLADVYDVFLKKYFERT